MASAPLVKFDFLFFLSRQICIYMYAYRHIRSTQESGKTQSKSEKEHLNLPSVSWLPQSFSLTPSTRPPPPFLLTKPLPINAEPSNLLFIPSGGAKFTDQLRSNLGGVFLSRGGAGGSTGCYDNDDASSDGGSRMTRQRSSTWDEHGVAKQLEERKRTAATAIMGRTSSPGGRTRTWSHNGALGRFHGQLPRPSAEWAHLDAFQV